MRTPACRCRLSHGRASDYGIAEVLMMPGESVPLGLPRHRIPDQVVFDHVIAALAGMLSALSPERSTAQLEAEVFGGS